MQRPPAGDTTRADDARFAGQHSCGRYRAVVHVTTALEFERAQSSVEPCVCGAAWEEVGVRKLKVTTFVTLDGVMQAPGGPDEDRSGGFTHGGWSVGYWDDQMGKVMGEFMGDRKS